MSLQEVVLGASLAVIAVGVYGLTSSSNLIRQLLSVEVIFNGVLLLLILIASTNPNMLTLLMVVLVAVVSGEVIVVIALVISMYRATRELTSEALREEGV